MFKKLDSFVTRNMRPLSIREPPPADRGTGEVRGGALPPALGA